MDQNLIAKFIEALVEFVKGFFGVSESSKKYVYITHIPEPGEKSEATRFVQKQVNAYRGQTILTEDGDYGPKTKAEVSKIQKENGLAGSGIIGPLTLEILNIKLNKEEIPRTPVTNKSDPTPWLTYAYKHNGKSEKDAAFNNYMSKFWYLVGLDLKTIKENWAAWCGLFVAYALERTGFEWQKDGALARNWRKYALEIKYKTMGIPRGAIVHINHTGNCGSSSSNHVGFAAFDYTPAYLSSPENIIGIYGGNTSNTAKIGYFKVKTICNVRWVNHKDYPLPGKVTKTTHSGSGVLNESTV